MKTQFNEAIIDLPGLGEFFFDGNSKITCDEGSFEQPAANAFSLVQVLDCPGSTKVCRADCYVHGLQRTVPLLHNHYVTNSINLRNALSARSTQRLLEDAFAEWIQLNIKKHFRWHVSGDIISQEHAWLIRNIALRVPNVTFWIYTRTLSAVKFIEGIDNLTVNLSADEENYTTVWEIHKRYGSRICYLTVDGIIPSDLPDDSVIFPSYDLRGRELESPKSHWWWKELNSRQRKMVCPPDFFGQSKKLRCGPCNKCLIK